jgi:hypothetical protein
VAAVNEDGEAAIVIIPPHVSRSPRLYLVCKELAGKGDPVMVLSEGGIYMSCPSAVHVVPEAMKIDPPKANVGKTNLAGNRCPPELYESRVMLCRTEAGRLYEKGPFIVDYAARGVLTYPIVDPAWAPLEYRELPVFSVRTSEELAKFKDLDFRLMPALDKSFWGIGYAELGFLMINGSDSVRATLTEKLRAENKEIWDRWCTTMFLGQFMLESLCYQRSGKSTGCLGWLLFGIRCTTCVWSITFTMEADLELENRYGSVNCIWSSSSPVSRPSWGSFL